MKRGRLAARAVIIVVLIALVGAGPDAIAIDQRAGRAYVAHFGDDSLSTIDLASGRTLRTVDVLDPTR